MLNAVLTPKPLFWTELKKLGGGALEEKFDSSFGAYSLSWNS